MQLKLFVGNLPFQVDDQELEDLFKEYGEVLSSKIILDRRTGRSRGFGFIEMSSTEQAEQALEALNGFSLRGRQIRVSFAKSQEDSSRDDRDEQQMGHPRKGGLYDES